MVQLDTLTREFEGRPLTTVTWEGRPAWVARHIGDRLGYSQHGKRLVTKILGEWNAEFQEGHDYAFLDGDELAQFRQVTSESPVPVSSNARNSLLVLFESGLHLVLTKTRRPVGVRLRRFLADEVLPQIVRDGRYDPSRQVDDFGVMDEDASRLWTMPSGGAAGVALVCVCPTGADRREDRLLLQARTRALWVDLQDRKARVQAIHRVLETLREVLDGTARIALEITAAEIATGLHVQALLGDPEGEPTERDVIDAPRQAA